jgi:glycosyltransferase involved in cell wall biosynthesis/peptidoglycan/xylan/chitin deacetylase (PgdA/CDA1 family)
MSPALSFVIAAYNAVDTLTETIASLQRQTRDAWEAIIVNDGSSDDTGQLASRLASQDARIIVHGRENGGASQARNDGLARATADWVTFLDADDWVDPSFVEIMLGARDRNPQADAIYCGYQRITPDGSRVTPSFRPEVSEAPFRMFCGACPVAIHSVVIKKSLVLEAGAFDPGLQTCEDWDLWQRVARLGAVFVGVPELLALYRESEFSLSRKTEQLLADGFAVLRRGGERDPRLANPAPEFVNGMATPEAAASGTFLAAWCAGMNVGSGRDGEPLFDLVDRLADVAEHQDVTAATLLEGLLVGARATPEAFVARFGEFWPRLAPVSERLAAGASAAGTARALIYALERQLMAALPSGVGAELGYSAKVVMDPGRPRAIAIPPRIDTLWIELVAAQKALGWIVTPVFGHLTRKDAQALIVSQLEWRAVIRHAAPLFAPLLAATALRAGKRATGNLLRLANGKGQRLGLKRAVRDARVRTADSAWRSSGFYRSVAALTKRMEADARAAAAPALAGVSHERSEDIWPTDATSRSDMWEAVFQKPDPWGYTSEYEQTKYEYTLELVPAGRPPKTLELACAEGIFTQQLAPKVGRLIAADISAKALERAKARCADHKNIDYLKVDLIDEPLPGEQDLILCSEVLYYLAGADELKTIAAKIRDALVPGGRLVMANHFLLRDDPSSTGFDWDQAYGGKVIHEVFRATPELALEESIVTELYRIDRFVRLRPGQPAPKPNIRRVDTAFALEPQVARYVVWGGAAARRSDLMQTERTRRVPVLTYHSIAESGPEALRTWRVHPEMFKAQIRLLRSHGFYSITSEQLYEHRTSGRHFPGRPILISFDDAYADFAETAWPILRDHDFSAEVFVVTDRVGQTAIWDAEFGDPARLMDWPTIERLHAEGVRFGSHLASHTPASNLSSLELLREAVQSRALLEEHLGAPVRSIAAPYGAMDQRYNQILRLAGYDVGFSCVSGIAEPQHNRHALPRLEVNGAWELSDFADALGLEPNRAAAGARPARETVSVIIPAYNGAATIDETLRSVRSQTYSDLEIIVVDDGSKDQTRQIVESHARHDPRVRLIVQENAGVAAARNRGVAEAKGELIAPVDADDLWAPTKIEAQMRALRRGGPGVGLVYTWFAIIDGDGFITDTQHQPEDEGNVLARLCRGNLVGNGSSPLIRKSAIQSAGGYDPGLRAQFAQGCEDLLVYFRIAEHHQFAVVPAYLTGYRQTREAMSMDVLQMFRSYRIVAKEMAAKYPRHAAAIRWGEAHTAEYLLLRALRRGRVKPAAFLFLQALRLAPISTVASLARRCAVLLRQGVGQNGRTAPMLGERFLVGSLEEAKAA